MESVRGLEINSLEDTIQTRRKQEKHGMSGTKIYKVYRKLLLDVDNGEATMCDEWKGSFVTFLKAVGDMSEHRILRLVDESKGYAPGNARWVPRSRKATRRHYVKDKMEYGDHSMTLKEWAIHYKVPYSFLKTVYKLNRVRSK